MLQNSGCRPHGEAGTNQLVILISLTVFPNIDHHMEYILMYIYFSQREGNMTIYDSIAFTYSNASIYKTQFIVAEVGLI